jgi:hypothetical protein
LDSEDIVTPGKTGVQPFRNSTKTLDSGFLRNDEISRFLAFSEPLGLYWLGENPRPALNRDKIYAQPYQKPIPGQEESACGRAERPGPETKSHPAQGRMAFFSKP